MKVISASISRTTKSWHGKHISDLVNISLKLELWKELSTGLSIDPKNVPSPGYRWYSTLGVKESFTKYVEERKMKAVELLQQFPGLLISRGGQVIKTLEKIEKPKDNLRKEFNEQVACY